MAPTEVRREVESHSVLLSLPVRTHLPDSISRPGSIRTARKGFPSRLMKWRILKPNLSFHNLQQKQSVELSESMSKQDYAYRLKVGRDEVFVDLKKCYCDCTRYLQWRKCLRGHQKTVTAKKLQIGFTNLLHDTYCSKQGKSLNKSAAGHTTYQIVRRSQHQEGGEEQAQYGLEHIVCSSQKTLFIPNDGCFCNYTCAFKLELCLRLFDACVNGTVHNVPAVSKA